MQNDQKEYVNTYIPRKCFATNRILDAKDKGSVQINFSNANLGKNKDLTIVLSGFIRAKGGSDGAVNRYLKQQGLLSFE